MIFATWKSEKRKFLLDLSSELSLSPAKSYPLPRCLWLYNCLSEAIPETSTCEVLLCMSILKGKQCYTQTLRPCTMAAFMFSSNAAALPTSFRGSKGLSSSFCSPAHRPLFQRNSLSQRSNLIISSAESPDASLEDTKPEPITHMTVEVAQQAFRDAVARQNNDIQHLAIACAQGFVEVLKKCYPDDDSPSIFVVCGHGLTGLIGMHSAKILKQEGYEAAVYCSFPSKYMDAKKFCEDHGLMFYDFVPSTLDFYYQIVVDALLGVGFDGGDIAEPYWGVYEMLFSTKGSVISVDVPSGWDLTMGPRPIDVSADSYIKPDVLVSLGAPKICAKRFSGSFHYIAGSHLDSDYFSQRGISVPSYPANTNSVLYESSSMQDLGTGAVYGRPGQFNATLYTRKPRRTWVDIDDDMDLWDELE